MSALRKAETAAKPLKTEAIDIEVRPTTAKDAEGLSLLLNHLVRESPFLGPEPDEQSHRPDRLAAHIEQNLSGGRGVILGAFRAGRIVGYVEAAVGGFRANAHVVSIQGVGVLNAHQGLGVGYKLLTTLIDWARKGSKRRLALTVREDNEKAQALYRRVGFEVEGTLRDQIRSRGVYRAEHLMALILPDS